VIATASSDGVARVWDRTLSFANTPPVPHQAGLLHAAFSPDGSRIVTASQDRTARVWDGGTGVPVSPPLAHSYAINHAAFSSDGKRVVTACAFGTARVWDIATGAPLTPPLKHDHPSGMRRSVPMVALSSPPVPTEAPASGMPRRAIRRHNLCNTP
jgi:WD40 repeat protein